jgi:hypothetical protein
MMLAAPEKSRFSAFCCVNNDGPAIIRTVISITNGKALKNLKYLAWLFAHQWRVGVGAQLT